MKRNAKTVFLCQGAIIAALYVVLTYAAKLFGLDSGVVQVRVSEMLCILPIFTPTTEIINVIIPIKLIANHMLILAVATSIDALAVGVLAAKNDSPVIIVGNKLNEIGECLWYLNPFRPSCSSIFPSNGSGTFHTRLGEHCFYRPTEVYANT